jgi:hypothetical protein
MDKAIITIVPHTTSGAAPTLAVDGLTARQIRSATGVNVPVGALIAGTPYVLIYINASTEFILLGGTAETNGIDALASTGLVARTALGTYAARALQSASAGLTWTNGDGVAGNPTPVLANDLAALEALSGTSTIYYRSGTDAWSAVTIGSSLSFSGGTLAAVFASQTDQETSTSTTAAVNPAVQQFHPSAAKFWANINGASSAALRVSYNITSLTDNGTGDNTLTIATDFSGADWVAASMGRSSGALGDAMMVYATAAAPTSGTVRINNLQKGSDTQLNSDINAVVGFGDQ